MERAFHSDTARGKAIITSWHVLEFIRVMAQHQPIDAKGVTVTEVKIYFNTQMVASTIRRLKAQELLSIDRQGIPRGGRAGITKYLVLSKKAKKFLKDNKLEHEGFLSKKNPRLNRLYGKLKYKRERGDVGYFEYKLPTPLK